jgi:hypothetical protein
MMEAVITSETSVNFYQATRRNNPEDKHPQKMYFPWHYKLWNVNKAA